MKARLALILTIPLILIGIAARSGAQNSPTLICSGGWCPPFTITGNDAVLAGNFQTTALGVNTAASTTGTAFFGLPVGMFNFKIIDAAGSGDRLRIGVSTAGSGVFFQSTNNAEGAFEPMNFNATAATFTGIVNTNSSALAGTAMNSNGTIFHQGLTAESGTKSAVCLDGATFQLETNAAATCTVSSLRFKEWKQDISCPEARRIVKGMHPAEFKDKDGGDKPRFGFAAEWTYQVEPRLVYTESDGKTPRAVDYERYVAVLTKVLQCGGLN